MPSLFLHRISVVRVNLSIAATAHGSHGPGCTSMQGWFWYMNTVKLMEPRLLTVKEGNCKYGKGELRMDPMVLNWNWRNQWESSFPYTYMTTWTLTQTPRYKYRCRSAHTQTHACARTRATSFHWKGPDQWHPNSKNTLSPGDLAFKYHSSLKGARVLWNNGQL